MFRLVTAYPDCIIIQKQMPDGLYKTQIRDCEGDILRSCVKGDMYVPEDFYEYASKYSIEEVRRIKAEEENKWRKEFVEA